MTIDSHSRRNFVQWMVSSAILGPGLSKSTNAVAPNILTLPLERQCKSIFGRQIPEGARYATAAKNGAVLAAIFETTASEQSGLVINRWLCVASERLPNQFSIQVSNNALRASTSFHPTDVDLDVKDDGSVEVSEQHLRSHTRLTWVEKDGKWLLANMNFAGSVAHKFVTEDYDYVTEEFVTTVGLIESDEPYYEYYRVSTTALVELGTYCNGQSIA